MSTPTIHLIKLFVGLSTFTELVAFEKSREGVVSKHTGRVELAHLTRHAPKRAAELIGTGGSIYWVMSGLIVGRQPITEFRPIETKGETHCAIILGPPLVAVKPQPRRPFQGWRYLTPEDAPDDLPAGQGFDQPLPPDLARTLAKLGLI